MAGVGTETAQCERFLLIFNTNRQFNDRETVMIINTLVLLPNATHFDVFLHKIGVLSELSYVFAALFLTASDTTTIYRHPDDR